MRSCTTLGPLAAFCACWSDSAPTTSIRVHAPRAAAEFSLKIGVGEQVQERKQICSRDPMTPDQWKARLERDHFGVELGPYLLGHQGWDETFALRFRRPPFFGDLVVRPGDGECDMVYLRLQYARGSKPDAWRSKFELEDFYSAMREVVKEEPPLFDPSPGYPPGYP